MSDPQDHVWPDDAACAGHPLPELFDAFLDGEAPADRELRHDQAIAICRECPVQVQCLHAVDPRYDDGIRGGILLTSLNGSGFGGYGRVQGIPNKRRKSA